MSSPAGGSQEEMAAESTSEARRTASDRPDLTTRKSLYAGLSGRSGYSASSANASARRSAISSSTSLRSGATCAKMQ